MALLLLTAMSCGSGDRECKADDQCKSTGLCTYDVNKDRCVAANDKDCTYRSFACRDSGHCVASSGKCVATSNAHCQQSSACTTEGRCVQMGGTCVPQGTKVATFGDICSKPADCIPNLLCITVGNRTRGHCSKTCTTAICPGAPAGSMALCILTSSTDKNTNYCAFVCQYKDSGGTIRKATCPSYQSCSVSEDPPGSGQRVCVP